MRPAPRADPGVPDSGTGLLSRVSDGEASLRPRVQDAGSGQELVGDAGDAAPGHAVLLAAPPQRRQPGPHHPVPERRQPAHAARDGEVGEPAAYHPPEPAADGGDPVVHPPSERLPDRPEPSPHPSADGLAPEDEAGAVPSGPAKVGEPEEVERLRPAEAASPAGRDRTLAELDQRRLLRVQSEPEPGQPLPEVGEEPLRVPPVLEADDPVVGVAHDDHVAGRVASPPPRDPEVGGVVEEDVGEQRARHSTHNLAKLLLDPSVTIRRERLRPKYRDGFWGAPLAP